MQTSTATPILRESPPPKPVFSVTALPIIGYRTTAPLWWGNLLMMVIEGMVFVLCIAAYFYLRLMFDRWPPSRVPYPDLTLGTANAILIALSFIPLYLVQKATEKDDEAAVKLWIGVGILMGLGAIALRVYEYHHLYCRWDMNAYGSVVWLLMSLHSLHLLAGLCETILLAVWAYTHKLDKKHRLDLEVLSYYWYFVVISWIVIYVVIYLTPHWI